MSNMEDATVIHFRIALMRYAITRDGSHTESQQSQHFRNSASGKLSADLHLIDIRQLWS